MFCETRSLHSSWRENRCRCGPNWPKIQDPGGADIPHGACLILKTPKKLAMERLLIHSHVMKVRTAVTISARKDEKSTVDSTWRCNMLACNTKKNGRSQSCLWLQAALERIMWGTGIYDLNLSPTLKSTVLLIFGSHRKLSKLRYREICSEESNGWSHTAKPWYQFHLKSRSHDGCPWDW